MDATQQDFFRFALASHIFSKTTAEKVLSDITLANEGIAQDLKMLIEDINNTIKQFDLEIVIGKSEISGNEYVALVQVSEKNLAEQVKLKDKKSNAFFSRLLTKICQSENGFITTIEALNASSDVEMSKSSAQTALDSFIRDYWIETDNENILIGIRSIVELSQMLSSTYPAILKSCPLCRKSVFYGRTCGGCKTKSHIYCLEKYFTRSRSCPHCKTNWTDIGQVSIERNNSSSESEEEIRQMDSSRTSRKNVGPSRPKRSRISSDSE